MPEIKVGTLYSVVDYPGMTHVITNPRESGIDFCADVVFTNEKGERFLERGCSGTMSTEHIKEIIGEMSLEELIEAVKRGYDVPEYAEEMIGDLKKRSKLGSRNV